MVNLPNTELNIPLDANSFSNVHADIRGSYLVAIIALKAGKFSSYDATVSVNGRFLTGNHHASYDEAAFEVRF